jgi:hypothetical protein
VSESASALARWFACLASLSLRNRVRLVAGACIPVNKAALSVQGDTPLHLSAQCDKEKSKDGVAIIAFLLSKGADVDMCNRVCAMLATGAFAAPQDCFCPHHNR